MTDPQLQKVRRLLGRISAKCFDTRFVLDAERDKVLGDKGRIYLQPRYMARCNNTGQLDEFKGRMWYLSEFMTDDEIIKTAYVAFKMAIEHEIMEGFRVDGKILFNPHVDYQSLLSISSNEVYRDG